MRALALLALLIGVLLSSCTTPSAPPAVDASAKRPANSRDAVELQACRHALHNTRLLTSESARLAATAGGALQRCARPEAQAEPVSPAPSPPAGNAVFTIHFAFAKSEVRLSRNTLRLLLSAVHTAPLIHVRGRTDGAVDSPGESRIARERALAVKALLVQAGVDPARIRATYQPTGDPVADNATAAGQGRNRRVEVEIYRSLPVDLVPADFTQG
jgi:outer membrane protein OmpA-like peptidoglycan-associated protein